MPRKLKIDAVKLYEEYRKNPSIKEQMNRFGLKTSAQVYRAIYEAQIKRGELPPPKRTRGIGRSSDEARVKVGKRGNLPISPKIVLSLGLQAGDRLLVKKRGENITLRKI